MAKLAKSSLAVFFAEGPRLTGHCSSRSVLSQSSMRFNYASTFVVKVVWTPMLTITTPA